MSYEAVIGLEIHVQLNCPTKLFCNCANVATEQANSHVCPICIWLPGAMPQLSENALEAAALTCLALNCEIQEESVFDQKVYYYPDLPKGFQLSQHHKPLSRNGWLDITGEDGKSKRLRIHHIHMEEDVAKLVHETEGQTRISLVDFNRAGAPLVEVVTEPDMRCPHDAMAFLRALRTQIRYAGTAAAIADEKGLKQFGLAFDFKGNGTSHRPYGLHVFDLHLGEKLFTAGRTQGNIRITPHGAAFHTACSGSGITDLGPHGT